MKNLVLVGVLVMAVTSLHAESPPTNNGGAQGATSTASTPAAAVAWAKIKADLKPLQGSASTDQETVQKQVTTLLGESHDFAAKFPTDPNTWNATMLWAQLGGAMIRNHWEGAPSSAEIEQAYDRLVADKSVPVSARGEIRAMQLLRAMAAAAQETGDASAKWAAVEDGIAGYQKEFGDNFSLDGQMPTFALLRQKEITLLSTGTDSASSEKILKKIANDPQPQIAEWAKKGLDRLKLMADLKTKPLEMKFAAVDGREVDMAKLRGKVVLIDFWATWCGPCVERVPDVIEAYRKYHDKGLEIIGISLDEDKEALFNFTRRKGMAWPQYFDGLRFDNKISSGFDIDAIPAMWLLDKKGMVASTDAGDDLQAQVERLLKAP